ncbi:MAG TPA: plastocyanin/azurin family copper-binding protein, partial [Actinomycetota bacterium]|nr:plastocyanin/azurin family copper-binding protein [Actinomycetota bacterium]
ATWSRTFPASLAAGYHCTPHPWMKAGVRVGEPGKAAPVLRQGAAASMKMAAGAPPPVARSGNGPVTVPVNIVEPSLSDAMGWGFAPKVVDLKAGDTVVWRNTGTMEHSVTGDGGAAFDAGLIKPAATFERKFDAPGVYAYHCTPHPWMKGIVRVATADGGAVPAISAGTDSAPSGGSGQASAAPAESARSIPGHILGKIKAHGSTAVAKLGWALLLSALLVGFTLLLSWVWEYPVPATARIQTGRDLIR